MVAKSRALGGCVITALVALVMGLLIGHYGIQRARKEPDMAKIDIIEQLTATRYHSEDDIVKYIIREIDEDRISENLKELSKEPHIAGTQRDDELAKMVRQRWKEDGLDEAKLVPYNVLLSYPTEERNQVYIVDSLGNKVYQAANKENVVKEGDTFAYAFNGFSPAGDVTGHAVYVNYGRVEDFDQLEQLGVNVSDVICIARYGKIFRGNKVENAEKRGAIGVVLFLDPSEVALDGTDEKDVYPNSWWMPGDAMQRGTVYNGNGDPLTPGYPSVANAYRYPKEEVNLPRIPAQPIGYSDAREILRILSGPVAPANWSGGLDISYHLGPGFDSRNADRKIRLIVNNRYQQKISYNVIGLIQGEVEPDRYVLLGNHRDAWGYGAVDASSGTAQLLEVTRVLGKLHKDGWKPRRTLVFCSWGAEEYGLIGSTEWVEEHIHELAERAVGYINVDICTSGDYFDPAASPMLAQVLKMAAEQVSDPSGKENNLLKAWKAQFGKSDSDPPVKTLGSGSDHAPFSFFGGIAALDITWGPNRTKYPISGYPPYHTAYETYKMMKFIDPEFKMHKSCAQLSSVLLHILSNSDIIPYNLIDMASMLENIIDNFESSTIITKLRNMGLSLDMLKDAIKLFRAETEKWHNKLRDIDTRNPLNTKCANDRMMMVERVFVKPEGLPHRPYIRHVAFAPSQFDKYSSKGFPAISDLLYGFDNLSISEQKLRKRELERHISDLIIIVNMATKFINIHGII